MVTEADWMSWKPEHFQPYIETALQAFGPDRLMIGSDWPVCRVVGSYGKVMSLVIEFLDQHAPDAREKFLGGNAQRAYLRDEAL